MCVSCLQVRRRVFRKSLKLYFYLLLKFAGPAFGIILYLAGMYLWDALVMNQIEFAKDQVYYSQQRRVLVSSCEMQTVFAHTSPACAVCVADSNV